ncbi:MAG: DUF1232 domain-containing protein [Nitrospirae bacterium]|nr:DUF1232 domain-containing protein [Nitrospirota bacterium]
MEAPAAGGSEGQGDPRVTAVEGQSERISEQRVAEVLGQGEMLDSRLNDLPSRFRKMGRQVRLLFSLVRDVVEGTYRTLDGLSLAIAAAAILYFLNPFDLIPDAILVVGLTDDALVVGGAVRALQKLLRDYAEFKRYDPNEFF